VLGSDIGRADGDARVAWGDAATVRSVAVETPSSRGAATAGADALGSGALDADGGTAARVAAGIGVSIAAGPSAGLHGVVRTSTAAIAASGSTSSHGLSARSRRLRGWRAVGASSASVGSGTCRALRERDRRSASAKSRADA
jgi:hypothetical protein